MEPLKVFISSVMNRALEDLTAERNAAKDGVDSFAPIACTWAFESEPASSKPPRDSCIDAVKQCHVLALILGRVLTPVTKDEYDTARDYQKPILVFCKDVPARDPETLELLRGLDVKYAPFREAADLGPKVREAVGQQIRQWVRSDSSEEGSLGDRLAQLRAFKRAGTKVRVTPLIPPCQYDLFAVAEVEPATVTLKKQSSGHSVPIPAPRIAEVLVSGTHEPATVLLDGRLQWLTIRQEWKFLPERPDPADGLRLGFSNNSPMQGPNVQALSAQLAERGRRVSWSRKDKLPERLQAGYEVFYDSDGRYLCCPGPDIDSVLVVAPGVRL